MQCIDVNADMGESTALWPYHIGNDMALMDYVSSINIATGFHAGDVDTMKCLVEKAIEKKVAIGAHPSFPDKENFGRTPMKMELPELFDMVALQIETLKKIATITGGVLHHVKPHGALYNAAAKDWTLANTIAEAIKSVDENLLLYGLSGSVSITAAQQLGIKTMSEVFADRTYQDDGSLTPRSLPNALITDEQLALQQVLQMVQQQTVTTVSGKTIAMRAETICIHSDGVNALAFAKAIATSLQNAGIAVGYNL